MTSPKAWIIFFVFFLLLFILCFFSTYSLANTFTYFLLSADTRGYLEAHEYYTTESRHGDMTRRATLIKELRQKNPSLLLLDAGNAFFGGQSLAHKGEAILSSYNALGYDALNLSFRDFRFGKGRTMELIEQANFPVLSANLLDSTTHKAIAEPYTIFQSNGQKIGLIGVTQQPAGCDYLPHLQEQLAGILIESPQTSLKRWLPQAQNRSDRVVLLYYGSYAGLKPILNEFGRDISLVLVGGSEPEYLPAEHKPPIIGTYPRGQHLAYGKLDIASGEVETEQVAVGPEIQPDAHMQAMLEPYLQETAWDYGQKAALKENVLLQSQAPDKRQQEATGSPLLQAKSERSMEERKKQSRTLAPGERIFTTNQDFDQGYLFNLNHKTPNEHQVQINTVPKPFPYVNVAASERGTVVRIDAETGSIVGEYRTAPEKRWRDPSRTTVDLMGNVWAGNREEDIDDKGSVVKIGLIIGGTRVDSEGTPNEKGEFLSPPFVYNTCVDRNNDGLIKTSRGLGNILPWPDRTDGSGGETAYVEDAEDECILLYQRTSGVAIRHVSVDADNNVWVGGYPQHPSFFDKLDGQTGSRLDTFSAAEIGCGGYGGLIDGNGVLWSSSKVQDKLLRYDPRSRTGICIPVHSSYGLGIDSKGFIWNSNHSWSEIVKIDPEGEIQPEFPKETGHWAALRGVAVTLSDDNIWVANSNLQDVSRLDNQGNLRKVIDVEDGPTGVAVDHNGKVWATNMRSDSVSRIDPIGGQDSLGAVDLTADLGPGAEPYNYSDMTGAVVAGATAKQGMWNLIYDSEISGTVPTTLHWNTEPSGLLPPGSKINVQVRAGESFAKLSSLQFQAVENGIPINLPGPYIEIRTILKKGHEEKSPVLSDLSILRGGGTGRLAVYLKGNGAELKPRIEIILDASGSMREQKRKIDGQLKIEVAKEVLAQIIKSLPENTEVAFRVYGHRIREGRPGDCEDTELLFPFGQLDRERLLEQIRRTQALGTTPLAFSLEQAAKDFPEDARGKVIILITDGKEECGIDPAATVADLVQKGLDIRVNVVGFGLAEESTKRDMEKVAQITGGTFFDAQDRQTLLKALQSPLSIPFEVFDSSGKRIADGTVGETIELPVGEYAVRAQVGTLQAEVSSVYIQNKKLREVELIFEKKTQENR
jgi:hypothetical protein